MPKSNDSANLKLFRPPTTMRSYYANKTRSRSSSPEYRLKMRGVDSLVSLPRERHVCSSTASDVSSLSYDLDGFRSQSCNSVVTQSITVMNPNSKTGMQISASALESYLTNSSTSSITNSNDSKPNIKRWMQNTTGAAAQAVAKASAPDLASYRTPPSTSPISWSYKPEVATRPHTKLPPSPPTTTLASFPTKKMIEIAPGVMMALRGAEETEKAIDNGFYVQSMCSNCQSDVFCILDCSCFICPDCKSMSPNPLSIEDTEHTGGLGLGFRMQG